MLDLAKLLILDGRPTQDMIDYLVDDAVKNIVNKAYSSMYRDSISYNYDMYKLFSLAENVSQYENITIGCHGKHHDAVIQDTLKSINRYAPFLTIGTDQYRKIKSSWGEIKEDPKAIVRIDFPLTLEVSANMKNFHFLKQDLSLNLENKNETFPAKVKI